MICWDFARYRWPLTTRSKVPGMLSVSKRLSLVCKAIAMFCVSFRRINNFSADNRRQDSRDAKFRGLDGKQIGIQHNNVSQLARKHAAIAISEVPETATAGRTLPRTSTSQRVEWSVANYRWLESSPQYWHPAPRNRSCQTGPAQAGRSARS